MLSRDVEEEERRLEVPRENVEPINQRSRVSLSVPYVRERKVRKEGRGGFLDYANIYTGTPGVSCSYRVPPTTRGCAPPAK